eukprot:SAG31_NODE_1131_length_9748_cov_3.466473_10_plen_130_part_00
MDEEYIKEAEARKDTVAMCCGSCATSVYVDLDVMRDDAVGSEIIVSNAGDSRVVAGHYDEGDRLTFRDLSSDHAAASNAGEVKRLRQEFPGHANIVHLDDSVSTLSFCAHRSQPKMHGRVVSSNTERGS